MSTDTLLVIDGLSKRFGAIAAVDQVSFSVRRGELLGFLGPNGAGKSTTMRMVAGYLQPDAGTIEVCGYDVEQQPIEVRKRLGYLAEGAPAYADMTARGLLDFAAAARGLGGRRRRERRDEMVDRLELAKIMKQPVETLSKGFKRRVGLALALLHDPDVLILDEPTDGLDPNQKHQVRTLLADLAPHKAIIISTHILEEVEALCQRAVVIAQGRVVADATPNELFARSSYHNAVTVRLPRDAADNAISILGGLPGVRSVERVRNEGPLAELIALPVGGGSLVADLHAAIEREQLPIEQLHVERGRLDEVFRNLTRAA